MLTICPQCRRHIHDRESTCPFCHAGRACHTPLLAAVAIGLAATSCSGNVTYEVSDATSTASASSSSSGDAARTATDGSTTLPDYGSSSSMAVYMSTPSSSSTSSLAPPYMAVSPDTGVTDIADTDASDSAETEDACIDMCLCSNICAAYIVVAPVSDPNH
jgi:hypothetical protein